MRLISCALIFYTLTNGCNTQFDFSQFFNQPSPQQPNYAYQNIPQSNDYDNNQLISRYLMNNYNYQQQCDPCSCTKCHISNSCCIDFCIQCGQSPPAGNPSVYLYPYPYIVVAPQTAMRKPTTYAPTTQVAPTEATTTTEVITTTEAITTTKATTTTEATTTTKTTTEDTTNAEFKYSDTWPSDAEVLRRAGNALPNSFLNKLINNLSERNQDEGNIVMTALRRTKPRWMPKYGIVPIPDQIAEKLMLRMRNMKVLHPEIDTIRRTGPI